MVNEILTSPLALVLCLLALPLLVVASIASLPRSPWSAAAGRLRLAAAAAACFAIVVVAARFMVVVS